MDSLSQFTLGAAMGELTLGKKIGNKAILWGGIAGTIPDLDIFFMPLIADEAVKIGFHRGFSHSFLFAIILSPILAWIARKIHHLKHPDRRRNEDHHGEIERSAQPESRSVEQQVKDDGLTNVVGEGHSPKCTKTILEPLENR